MYIVGDRFMLVKYVSTEDRGTLEGKVDLKTKHTVESVCEDYVVSGGWCFYLDEIKLVEKY